MNISNNFKKFREFITPPVFAARATYPGYRGRLAKIVTLSLFASLLEAGALGVLFVLLQVFTDKTVEEYVRWAFLRPYSESPGGFEPGVCRTPLSQYQVPFPRQVRNYRCLHRK
jgi:hypothetical protein